MGDYLPNSDLCIANGPDFELYPAEYDPADPEGWVEIWIPVAKWIGKPPRRSSSIGAPNCRPFRAGERG